MILPGASVAWAWSLAPPPGLSALPPPPGSPVHSSSCTDPSIVCYGRSRVSRSPCCLPRAWPKACGEGWWGRLPGEPTVSGSKEGSRGKLPEGAGVGQAKEGRGQSLGKGREWGQNRAPEDLE